MSFNGTANIVPQSNTVTLNGAISGAGSVNLHRARTMVFGAPNSYNGGTTIGSGIVVRAAANNALGTGPLYLNSGIVSSSGASAYSLSSPLVAAPPARWATLRITAP